MSTAVTKTQYTPEDLLSMPDGDRFEVVDGRLQERAMGWEAGYVSGELFRRLANFCHEHQLGWPGYGGDAGYQGFPDSPRTVRKPDVSFVRYGRFPGEQLPRGHAQLVPDLAAEVISPNDLYEDVEEKVEEYLRAGVRLVWVISPRSRTVQVYRPDRSCARLGEDGVIDGEDVIPGFRCPVRDLFPRPPATPGNGQTDPAE